MGRSDSSLLTLFANGILLLLEGREKEERRRSLASALVSRDLLLPLLEGQFSQVFLSSYNFHFLNSFFPILAMR